MVVHVVADHPKSGRPQAAPLIGLCGQKVSGFYLRVGHRSSKGICPGCRAALAKGGESRPSSGETEPDEASD
jgi:hypothetical protein